MSLFLRRDTEIFHSKEGSEEVSIEYVRSATDHIGDHCYTSNWIAGDCR